MKISIPWITYALNEMVCGRDTLRELSNLKKIETYSSEKLREYQLMKLKKLLTHAYENVGYYRETFEKSGFGPGEISALGDLEKIPLLTKDDIRGNPGEFVAGDRKRKLTRRATSGSTGEPLIFYMTPERIAGNKAAYLMLYEWWGLHPGDREVVLWGSSGDCAAYNILKRVRDKLLNTRLLPSFNMNEKIMRDYLSFIRGTRPKDIFGYAHTIYLMARFAKNRKIVMDDLGIGVIFTTAELLQDYQRDVITEVFGCPVSNCYGGRESGFIAFECRERTMHLNPNVIVEIISEGKPAGRGEKGEIVVTDLNAYGMPFIRYCTGDEGVLADKKRCACGRELRAIERVLGRNTDYLVNAKGEFIHPLALEYIFREMPGIDYFKIVQKKEDELVIDMAVTGKFDRNAGTYIRRKIVDAMGAPTKIVFRMVERDDIRTGEKHKFVVSEIIGKYL
jgi:phenylacetate-CoA ligase